jgi:hypothetical protein
MINAAMAEVEFLKKLPARPEAASTIIRGIYENFRMLGDALLRAQGLEATDHKPMVDALIKLPAKTKRPLQVLDNLRTLRHNINYKGYRPTEDDLRDALSILEACWDAVLAEVKKKVG